LESAAWWCFQLYGNCVSGNEMRRCFVLMAWILVHVGGLHGVFLRNMSVLFGGWR
jgi:hypothetical protein